MKLVEIFRGGKRIDSAGVEWEFTDEDISQVAETYNPKVHVAPFLEGHDETKPNRGLVDRVIKIGQSLFAAPGSIESTFKEMVNSGRIPTLSSALYHPKDPRNPYPGKWSLRHVAGVQIPAVKGMERPQFEEFAFGEGDMSIAIALPDPQILFSEESEETAEPQSVPTRGKTMTEEELLALEASLNARKAELDAQFAEAAKLQAEADKRQAALDRNEFAQFAETLLKDGRQFDKSAAIGLYMGLDNSTEIAFSESEQLPGREALKRFLQSLPKTVEFGEVAGGELPPEPATNPLEFAEQINRLVAKRRKDGIELSPAEAARLISTNPAIAKELGGVA